MTKPEDDEISEVFPDLIVDPEEDPAKVKDSSESFYHSAVTVYSIEDKVRPFAFVLGRDEVAHRAASLFSAAPEMHKMLQAVLLRDDIADDELGEEIRKLLREIES